MLLVRCVVCKMCSSIGSGETSKMPLLHISLSWYVNVNRLRSDETFRITCDLPSSVTHMFKSPSEFFIMHITNCTILSKSSDSIDTKFSHEFKPRVKPAVVLKHKSKSMVMNLQSHTCREYQMCVTYQHLNAQPVSYIKLQSQYHVISYCSEHSNIDTEDDTYQAF